MAYLKNTLSISVILLLILAASSSNVLAFSFDPPDEKTGAPNEGTCRDCHVGNTLNASGGSLMLTVPENYSPGVEYDIIVNLSRTGQSRWGFEMTALNSNGARAGTFATANANTQLSEENSKQYIKHTSTGTARGKRNANSWTFKWTAPSTNIGPITFYAAGNAANNDFGTSGDYIYTQKATSDVPIIYGVTLTGVGTLTRSTTDASAGVRYTLRVTNIGNTNDTIRLTTSGSASATLSQTSVSLAAGASANVRLTIPGTALAAAGDYKIKVTATSQGDSTKTAEVSTTTTILPVYGVSLAGVGTLTRSTTDASAGVRYTLRVTNTGNTNDTIRLTTSGDATATVNPTSVFLNRGSSRTVTLRVSDAALAQAGDYAVKVKATSQGDSTKTAEVSTTTTILPVYGITLVGIGDLTTETADASEGVTYTFTITNTGNTSDTINLATSEEAATLSQTSVSLASRASTNITLTIPGTALATAGEYGVTVTATSQGDNTKTAEVSTTTTILPVYDVMLAGVGDLTTETSDASEGVTYTLNVTNNGNTDDVIDLTASDEAATLSQSSVSLASGASAEVVLTIAGDVLANAGNYEVKATATSQGDKTKTAEVSTTTTILPVYGVSLAGVGSLTTETADASEGVTYTLNVTNTGNTDDIIDLATSDNATLNQSSVSLASGASAEVILTIAADVLTNAGDYEVKVTAISQGDNTKTAEITTTTTITPVYDVMLAGVGSLTTETADASAGVSYTLKVTNTSNTDDVIDLAASDEAATLSQTSVSLASGASAEVTLTIAADVLTNAGDYEVKVTAISQGDNIKTAEVSTKTTILPVYGVSLAGVGNLTTETADASAGVSYTLKVTNTSNTDDVIDLAASDEAATLSQTSVSLASGASVEVTLTIAADVLTNAGDYEVKVTAISQGDNIKTAEVSTTTTILPVYGVSLAGVGSLTTETADASEGVTYTLNVTNTGNTDDIIDLATSDNATLSQTSVSLASGASVEVTLTIAADVLTNAGDYEVKVTAISQGDNTKTAEVSTTTTILPVYGVSLAGVGNLTTETADASAGVSYTLKVTNTSNTDDVIDLAASDEAATLSQTSVSLASGASVEVTLTISADALTIAGKYDVIITATSQGDSTKTAEITTTTTITPVYGVMLAGVGNLTTETADASEGVTYTLNVTNAGNTDDIIDLATSDDNATLSQTSISLTSGASAEVTLTIAADVLTNAGDYEVKVTATSQGDNIKTAEVSTKTTILPVYGVMLNGVGALAKSTVDADDGINYTLRVINTGNTDDIIDLATSDDNATLSQTSISLTSGASAEVILTVSSDVLATAGKYDATVTATSQGDNTKTAQITAITTNLPVYGVMLTGVGDLTTETTDASEGVTYTLTITNTGNTDDVIDLTLSDEAATLSQTSVSLASGASAEVTLTIAGDVLANAGDYEVKAAATSQGDSTKTVEITTTTTILPAYGVMLAGVGDLTTETADANAGVSYTLKVTNTSNTDDLIDLALSDEAATLSQSSVSLASGASAEVVLTIAGDMLANAGNYEVKVTATSQGDNTKTAEVSTTTTILPVYGVMLTGEGALTGATMDTVAGVTYTLIVTNTGNTDDTISLSSSAEVGIGGSVLGSFRLPDTEEPATGQLEIMLGAGTSANVMFTASGDLLTKPGEYEIKVTATSQTDSTKTAEIITTTTILPVYGVTLIGKDDLKGTTMDTLAGVDYTLTITNTGNTDDTIMLGSSAEVGIEGSVLGSFRQSDDQVPMGQLEIELAAGASAEITFTAAGDFFTKPGEYEIKVTATSQGDNTKTAEITTVTAIKPVPWDINADGTVNIQDLVLVANQIGKSGEGLSGDVNMDGEVNILDLVQVTSYFGKTQAEIVQANQ